MLFYDGRLEAELLESDWTIGFVVPEDRILLRYQAYPCQRFGHKESRVAQISRSALSSGELGALIENAQQDEPFYRVRVSVVQQAATAMANLKRSS